MRCNLLLLTILLAAWTSPLQAAPPAPAESKDLLQEGKNVPTTFHPYNVNGPRANHFHCLITEYDLDPVVLIFAQGVATSEPLKAFLKQLEETINTNRIPRLRGVLVFYDPDELEEVSDTKTIDDLKGKVDYGNAIEDSLEKLIHDPDKANALVTGLGLKKVIVCIAGKAVAKKFSLNKDDRLVIVLYHRLRILGSHRLTVKDVTDEKLKKILSEVQEKFKDKR